MSVEPKRNILAKFFSEPSAARYSAGAEMPPLRPLASLPRRRPAIGAEPNPMLSVPGARLAGVCRHQSFHEGTKWGLSATLAERLCNRENFDIYVLQALRGSNFRDGIGESSAALIELATGAARPRPPRAYLPLPLERADIHDREAVAVAVLLAGSRAALVGGGTPALSPASMARLPARRAWVFVRPPLFASGPNFGSMGLAGAHDVAVGAVVKPVPPMLSPMRLCPWLVMAP